MRRSTEGSLHLCFLRLPVDLQGESLKIEPVLREKIMLVLPTGHRLATKSRVPLRQLAAEPFIIFPRAQGVGFYDQLVSLCRQAGFSPRVVQEASQMQTILSLVAARLGVALIPATVQSLRSGDVVYRHLRGRLPETGIAVARRRDDSTLLEGNFLNAVREAAARFSKQRAKLA